MSDHADSSPSDYLREVRRVRARFADRPTELSRQLRDLAARRDSELRSGRQSSPVNSSNRPASRIQSASTGLSEQGSPEDSVSGLTVTVLPSNRLRDAIFVPSRITAPARSEGLLAIEPEVAEKFCAEIESMVEAGILRFTARKRLLARAARLNIGRFDANLLIASVLHATPASPTAATLTVRPVASGTKATCPKRHVLTIALVLLAEAVAFVAIAWLM